MNRTALKDIVCNVWNSPFLKSNNPNCLGNITFVFRQGWRSNTPCVHPPLLYWLRLKRPIIHCSGLLQLPPLPSDWSSQHLFLHNNPEHSMGCRGGAGQVFGQKEWLLTLENLQTFGQSDVWTKTQKYKQTNREFNIRMSGQFRILATFFICIKLRFDPKTVIAYNQLIGDLTWSLQSTSPCCWTAKRQSCRMSRIPQIYP